MNKLISRNPILRFKLGRKIVKAESGWKFDPYTGRYRNPVTRLSITKEQYKLYKLDKLRKAGYIDNNNHWTSSTVILNKKGNSLKPNSTKVTPQKSSYDKFIYANEGKLGGWNKSIGLGNIDDLESLDIIKQLGWEGKSAEEVLKLLNSNDIGGNRVVVDNKWGNQSKAALQNYYSRWKDEQEILHPTVKKENSSTIQLPQAPIMLRQAISDYSNYASNLKSALGNNNNFQGLSNLVWKEYADDDNSFAANFSRDMRTRFKDYGTLLSWLDNQAAIEKMLNISGRYRGSRSGDFGDIARSQASWAGEYNQGIDKLNLTALNNYNLIIDKYKRTVGGYKIGGILPSRNIVKRFKNRKFN